MSGGGGGGRGGRGGGGGAQEGRLAKALVDTKLARVGDDGLPAAARSRPGAGLRDADARISRSTRRATPSTRRSTTIVKNPPTDAEVDRVKTQLLRGLENSLSNAQAIATGALNNAIAQGDWRLMFLQHDRLQDGHAGGSGARRARRTSSRPTGRSATTSPTRRPIARWCRPRRIWPRRCATTRARSPSRAAKRSIPTIANIDEPHRPLEAAQRHEGRRSCSKKTANNIVTGDDRPAVRRSDVARGPARSGGVRRQPADGRHQDAHAAAAARTRCAS